MVDLLPQLLLQLQPILIQPLLVPVYLEGQLLKIVAAKVHRPHNLQPSTEPLDLEHEYRILNVLLDLAFDLRHLSLLDLLDRLVELHQLVGGADIAADGLGAGSDASEDRTIFGLQFLVDGVED